MDETEALDEKTEDSEELREGLAEEEAHRVLLEDVE